jgi:hypothetical protein
MVPELGKLKKVPLRDIWETEDRHFTPWLAQENNIEILGKEIGIDIEVEATEKQVGPFRADILCKDTVNGKWVLIENQLEPTDHKHLGQLLTYATGLDAVTIIWIAEQFSEEHRATLDWLNNITDETLNFFGIEIELWKIGDSPSAPRFRIVSKPNDWIKSMKSAARTMGTKNLTKTKLLQFEFWKGFHSYLSQNSDISPRSPRAQHWMDLGLGRTGTWHRLTMNTRDKWVSSGVTIKTENRLELYHQLHDEKETIESELGFELDWWELADKKESYIGINHLCDTKDESKWPEMYIWLTETLEEMHKVFNPRVKK